MKKIFIFSFLGLSLVITSFILNFFEEKKQEQLNSTANTYFNVYKTVYKEKKELSAILFSGLSEIANISERLAQVQTANAKEEDKNKIRNTIYNDLELRYKKLEAVGIKGIHIHLKNNKSFLRMHMPSKYDDDLTTIRPTVNYVNKYHKPIDSFEEGSVNHALRFVYPIFNESIHVGSMEIAFSASSITSSIMKQYYVLSNFFIDSSIVNKINFDSKNSMYKTSHHKGYYSDKDVLKKLKEISRMDMKTLQPKKETTDRIRQMAKKSIPSSIYDDDIGAVFTIIPIINKLSNKNLAFLTVRSKSKNLILSNTYTYIVVTSTIFFLMIVSFLIFTLLLSKEKLQKKVKEKTKQLEELNTSLEDKILEKTIQLNNENERFTLAMNTTKDGLWDWNPITNKVYFSTTWKSMLGYNENEIKDNLDEWTNRVHPDDIDKVYQDVQNHLNGNSETYENIHRMKHKNGLWLWIYDRGKALYNENNEAYRVIGFHTDITIQKNNENNLLKKTEEQDILLSLFDKGESVLFKWNNDKNWTIDYVSKSVEKLLGYNKNEFINGDITYAKCIHKDDLNDVIEEVEKYNNLNNDFFKHKVYRLVCKNADIKYVQDYTVIIKDSNNTITHYLGYITDITNEKENEFLKNEQEKFIIEQSKNAQMGEMIGNIAHQWRQPLSVISTSASAMGILYEMENLSNEKFQKYTNSIVKSTTFLSNTIDTFRDYIKEKREKKEVVLQDRVSNAIDIVEASILNNHIKLIRNIQAIPIKITIILGELSQVIINLINNSKDALLEKKIEDPYIKISIERKENIAFIVVEDNAKGIPKDIIHKVFDPYFTTKHQSQGTGLGLHMSKDIIEKHLNGKLYVENGGDGAIFTIELSLNKKNGV